MPTIVGIFTVTVLAAAMIVVWQLPGSRWSVRPIVTVASFLLALGWPTLACLHMPWLVQAVLALGGTLTSLGIAHQRNLDIAMPLTGITLVVLVAATILDASAPHDHSVGHVSKRWGFTVLSATLTSSMTCLLIVTSGSIWAPLTVHERWSGIIPMAALIAVIGAASARFRCSAEVGVAFVTITGLVADLMVASVAWFLEQTPDLLPIIFPFIAKRFGEFAAFLVLGSATGFGVGFTASIVDTLLGERASSAKLANILGCGAVEFLVAALPVYAMIHIGEI